MMRVCVLDWDNPFADRSGIIATLLAALNRMDAAALALEGEIDALAWRDLRRAIEAFKGRIQRGEVLEACSEDWEVLHSEVDRALQGRPFQKWYDLGAAIERYHFAASVRPFGAPLPDFRVVLDQAQRAFEDVGPGVVPVLGALVQHASGLAVTGPRRLLREVLGVGKYDDYPEKMDRAVVCEFLKDLHMELYQQLAGLTRPNPALPPFIPTRRQERALREVRGEALTAEGLQDILHMDRGQLYRDVINPLKAAGRLVNDRRLGGYYDPTAPPEKK
jgi:hypothetical protein